jgi:hypothetical protein
LAERRCERTAAEELENLKAVTSDLEVRTAPKRAALENAKANTREARQAYITAATAFTEEHGSLLQERARLEHIGRLISDAESAWKQREEQASTIERLKADIEACDNRLRSLRQGRQEALGQLSATFDYVVRAILGDEVEARVDPSGGSLSLVVDLHGPRNSAALTTVKLLAFDLAAITESVEGRGNFPRFLVHDGPREADLAADIFERLFLYAHQLEGCTADESPFQYIVTTTTRSPKHLAKEPWLRLRLAGAPAEKRFLRLDL